tara:strand:- start:713 stop:1312 length:600 start_codon:yes stop_codon:yes gene_type:complete
MSDCDCEKKNVDETWLDKNDYGDEFLREESFKIIRRILRDKKYYSINQDAVFNVKLDENEINEMSLDDVRIDYSYLKNSNFKGINNQIDEIELLEETGNTTDSTESVLSGDDTRDFQEEQAVVDATVEEKILDNILQEDTDTDNLPDGENNFDFSSMTEDDEELKDIVKNLSKKRQKLQKEDTSPRISDRKLDEILDEE